jgi:hypothetical protein
MTFLEQVKDFVSLGYTFTFSPGINGLSIRVSKESKERESWLPYSNHCDEGNITRCIAFMIDKMHSESIWKLPNK